METNWLTPEQVAEKWPLLTIRAQNQMRHKRDITYTKMAGRVVYKREWLEEYFNRYVTKAAS